MTDEAEPPMDLDAARHINGVAMKVVAELEQLATFVEANCSQADYRRLKRGVVGSIYVVLRVQYGLLGGIFHLTHGTVSRQFALDPTPIFHDARVLCAVLAMLGVVATFFVARRFWGAGVGLLIGGIFGGLPLSA